jgi:hypothetical protein
MESNFRACLMETAIRHAPGGNKYTIDVMREGGGKFGTEKVLATFHLHKLAPH